MLVKKKSHRQKGSKYDLFVAPNRGSEAHRETNTYTWDGVVGYNIRAKLNEWLIYHS